MGNHGKEAKKNTLTNHDGKATQHPKVEKKVAGIVDEPEHQGFSPMTVSVGLCAALAVVGVAMVVKLRNAKQGFDASAADAAVPMASTLPSDTLAMTTADTKG